MEKLTQFQRYQVALRKTFPNVKEALDSAKVEFNSLGKENIERGYKLILSEIKDSILDSVIQRSKKGDETAIKILLEYCDQQLEQNSSSIFSYEEAVDISLYEKALIETDPTDPANRK